MLGLACRRDAKQRQGRFGLRRVGQQTVFFAMALLLLVQMCRVKIMQVVLHRVDEAQLQHQHQKPDG